MGTEPWKLNHPCTTRPTGLLSIPIIELLKSSVAPVLAGLARILIEAISQGFRPCVRNARISRRHRPRPYNQTRRRKISTCCRTLIRLYGHVDDGVAFPLFVALETDQAFARAIYPSLPWNRLIPREFFPT